MWSLSKKLNLISAKNNPLKWQMKNHWGVGGVKVKGCKNKTKQKMTLPAVSGFNPAAW